MILSVDPSSAAEVAVLSQSYLTGVSAVVMICVFSGFAGIYFEKV